MNGHDQDWKDRYVSLDDVTAEEPPWLIPGILPVGVTAICGPSGRHKTRFALQVAKALAVPHLTVLGRRAEKTGRVIYVPAEQSPRSLKFKAGWDLPKPDLEVWRMLVPEDAALWRLDDAPTMNRLLSDILVTQAVGAVIDPVSNFHRGDENDPNAVKEILSPLYYLAHKKGIAVVLVHHTKKVEHGRDRLTWDDVRGSGAFINACDGAHLFQKPDQNGTIEIETKFRDHAPGTLWYTPEVRDARTGFDVTELCKRKRLTATGLLQMLDGGQA